VIRSTEYELKLSKLLNIKMMASDPIFNDLGTKYGSKCIFKESKVLYPESSNQCFSEDDLAEEIMILLKKNSNIEKIMIKLNDSFSGNGNAILNLLNLKKKQEGWFSFSFQRSYWTFWSRFHGCVNKNETELNKSRRL
jgi:hypothetical protein